MDPRPATPPTMFRLNNARYCGPALAPIIYRPVATPSGNLVPMGIRDFFAGRWEKIVAPGEHTAARTGVSLSQKISKQKGQMKKAQSKVAVSGAFRAVKRRTALGAVKSSTVHQDSSVGDVPLSEKQVHEPL